MKLYICQKYIFDKKNIEAGVIFYYSGFIFFKLHTGPKMYLLFRKGMLL